MPSRILVLSAMVVAVFTATVVAGLVAQGPRTGARGSVPRAETAAMAGTVVVVAVGDIACPPGEAPEADECRQADTAALTRRLNPDAVLAVGDLQYDAGSRYDFRSSYDRSWGQFRPITLPVPGNHEYKTNGAAGYYHYFRNQQPGPPGYYTRRVGAWRVFALNTNCDQIRCRRESRWLRRTLRAHPSRCSLVMMHHPRFSSGEHGSNRSMRRFFAIADEGGVEVIVAGHDHDYERFARMNADGEPRRRGVMQFVSGAGGKSHYALGRRVPGSRYGDADHFGVLKLSLAPRSYSWAFTRLSGATPDQGSRRCS